MEALLFGTLEAHPPSLARNINTTCACRTKYLRARCRASHHRRYQHALDAVAPAQLRRWLTACAEQTMSGPYFAY